MPVLGKEGIPRPDSKETNAIWAVALMAEWDVVWLESTDIVSS